MLSNKCLTIALGLALVAGAALAQQKAIAIGTGGTGGVYYPLGGGLANVLSKNLPGVQATAEVTGGSVGSATEVMAFRVIEAAGLDKDKDMRRERLGVAESVNAIKDRKIDAFFWVGGLPTAAVTDLGATPGVKIKLIDHSDVVDKMNAKYGKLYVTDVIPARTYPGQDTDNKISTVWNILVANEKMPDDIAYAVVKIIFDHKPDLVAVHKEADNIDYKYQLTGNSPVPWHPGALKYFAEKGVKM